MVEHADTVETHLGTLGERVSAESENGQKATIARSKWTTLFGRWKTKHQEAFGHSEESWRQHDDKMEKHES